MTILKPCPLCGSEAFQDAESWIKCSDKHCTMHNDAWLTGSWNYFFCWKELDAAQKIIFEREVEIAKLKALLKQTEVEK